MGNQTQPAPQANQLVTLEKKAMVYADQATKWIQQSVADQFCRVPAGYNLGSELSLAMMKIAQTQDRNSRPALDVCTKDSILTALKLMAQNGLSMAKSECYPIVYGNTLTVMRSYFGDMTQLKRMFPNYKITANVIYDGDTFEQTYNDWTDCDEIKIVKRGGKQDKITHAYAFIKDITTRETVASCVMTKKEIDIAWSHAKTNKVQTEFPQEMAKRTVIKRLCKTFINSSAVDPETAQAFNAMSEMEFDNKKDATPLETEKAKAIRQRSQGNAGLSAILNTEDAEVVDVPQEPVQVEEVEVNEEGEVVEAQPEEKKTELNEEEIPF